VIAAAEHRLRALQLRKKGHTYREIGLQLDMSEQRAHQHVIEGLRRLNTERSELAEEVPQLELERLDTMPLALATKVTKSDCTAIQTALKIMARCARLLGRDAPDGLNLLLRDEAERMASHLSLHIEKVLQGAQRILEGVR